jgi:uncharacterized RDD family membrane protein YckC
MDRFAIYHPSDYAGFWRRAAIAVVDLTVLVVADVAAFIGLAATLSFMSMPSILLPLAACLAIDYLYLTVVKGSRFRTLGYRMARCRVVSISGEQASLAQMSLRLAVAILVNPLENLISVANGRHRQAVSDEVAGTLVVRTGAAPVGWSRRVRQMLFFMRQVYIVSRPYGDPVEHRGHGVESTDQR